jgi:hypothetical protein
MHIIVLVNGYVAAVGLAEQLRLVQCAAQCRDGDVLIVEAETRGVDLDVLVTTVTTSFAPFYVVELYADHIDAGIDVVSVISMSTSDIRSNRGQILRTSGLCVYIGACVNPWITSVCSVGNRPPLLNVCRCRWELDLLAKLFSRHAITSFCGALNNPV